MIKINRSLFQILLILCFTLNIFAHEAQARTTSGVRLEPAFIEIDLKQSEQKEFLINLTNYESIPIQVEVEFQNASLKENSLKEVIIEENHTTPRSWFKVSENLQQPDQMLIMNANQTLSVPITLNIPQEALKGTYYAFVLFHFKPESKQEGNIALDYQIASTIYLTIDGENLKSKIDIRQFEIINKLNFSTDIKINTTIENTGETYLKPRGVIEIYDPKNIRKSQVLSLNDKFTKLLPSQISSETLTWKDSSITNTLFPPVGKYQAELKVYIPTSQTNEEIIKQSQSFFVIPPIYIAYATLLIFLIVISVHSIKKITSIKKSQKLQK